MEIVNYTEKLPSTPTTTFSVSSLVPNKRNRYKRMRYESQELPTKNRQKLFVDYDTLWDTLISHKPTESEIDAFYAGVQRLMGFEYKVVFLYSGYWNKNWINFVSSKTNETPGDAVLRTINNDIHKLEYAHDKAFIVPTVRGPVNPGNQAVLLERGVVVKFLRHIQERSIDQADDTALQTFLQIKTIPFAYTTPTILKKNQRFVSKKAPGITFYRGPPCLGTKYVLVECKHGMNSNSTYRDVVPLEDKVKSEKLVNRILQINTNIRNLQFDAIKHGKGGVMVSVLTCGTRKGGAVDIFPTHKGLYGKDLTNEDRAKLIEWSNKDECRIKPPKQQFERKKEHGDKYPYDPFGVWCITIGFVDMMLEFLKSDKDLLLYLQDDTAVNWSAKDEW